ncbi:MAG: homoserine dehydrogenase, partial [Acidobacteriia bacterium]|nr:homoserine dehydrogenase [Terriglobia bacterium]
MGRALAPLLEAKRKEFPFRIVAIHTARHGTAFDVRHNEPKFGPRVATVEEFLDRAKADVAVELTTLNPATGEPAISHIRAAFARKMHVVTANKGPIAHAYADLGEEAKRAGVEFLFESTVMDG